MLNGAMQIHPWQLTTMPPAMCLVWLRMLQLMEDKLQHTIGNVWGAPVLEGLDPATRYQTYCFEQDTELTLPWCTSGDYWQGWTYTTESSLLQFQELRGSQKLQCTLAVLCNQQPD